MTLWNEIVAGPVLVESEPALEAVRAKFGMVPNVARAMAANPGTLGAYLATREALGSEPLGPLDVEAVSLAVSRVTGCAYCEAAHGAAARSLGADDDEVTRNLDGASADPRRAALAHLAKRLAEEAGALSDAEIATLRQSLSPGDMIAATGWVAVNMLTNMTNRLARTERDLG